jgi:hypothetical protein
MPKPKPEVCDLDALDADEAGEPFTFRFGGEDYTLPPKIDLRAVAALEGNRYDAALRMLLGPVQYERMQQASAVFDQRKFEALFNAYGAHQGVSLGESEASTDS